MEDNDVPAWWRELGIPGLFEAHVHFLPPPIERAVWAVFDSAGPKLGREWPIRYRMPVPHRVQTLRDLGVRRFTALPYAHKPGVAAFMNEWAQQFAADVPEALWSATFYPEPSAGDEVAALIEAGVEVFKLHAQVGEFALDDPLLTPAWGHLQDSRTPVVVHIGSGPVPNEFTGPQFLGRVLKDFPELVVIVAHMGAPEYAEFLDLALRYPNLRLDTTMVFTDFFSFNGNYPPDLIPRLLDIGDRVLLGSDFPTIPYAYAHQLEGLERLGLGEDWLRAVCWHNAARLFDGAH